MVLLISVAIAFSQLRHALISSTNAGGVLFRPADGLHLHLHNPFGTAVTSAHLYLRVACCGSCSVCVARRVRSGDLHILDANADRFDGAHRCVAEDPSIDHRSGWSVLIRGLAEEVTGTHHADLVACTYASSVQPWVPASTAAGFG